MVNIRINRAEQEILQVAKHIGRLEEDLQSAHDYYRGLLEKLGKGRRSEPAMKSGRKVPGNVRVSSLSARVLGALGSKTGAIGHKEIAGEIDVVPRKVRSALWYLKKKGLVRSTGWDRWKIVAKETKNTASADRA
jgi:hypothetical protein